MLRQNYPNPFNPSTTIEYGLPEAGQVTIELFDISGRSCGIVLDAFKPAGFHRVQINGANLSSGVYFYRMRALNHVESRKMMLVR